MSHIHPRYRFGTDEFQQIVDQRRRARMEKIDAQPQAIRELVHSYGWNVVNAFLTLGLKKPNHIRHLVETVLNEFSPTRGATSNQGVQRAPGLDPEKARIIQGP